MSRTTLWTWLRPLAGATILAALGFRLGAEPFVEGFRRIGPTALLVALGVTAVTTWCCARRWSLLADRLDVAVPSGVAFRACYRSQFLNATLPGGVVGDVHRAVHHGRTTGAMARGLRSVVWDRVTGQVVQALLALGAVVLLPSPLRTWALWLLLAAGAVAVVAHLGLPARYVRALWAEIRRVPGAADVWPRVALLSTVAAAGHLVVFVVAARATGITAPLRELVPIALVVLLASAVPLNIAGWGPREGASAWIFGAAGLGAGAGVQVAVAYGVTALVATLPGALALLSDRRPAPDARAVPGLEDVGHG